MFKVITVLAALMLVQTAQAEEAYYLVNGKKVAAKVEALIAKAKDANAQVYKCAEQELSNKGTLKNK